MCQPPSPEEVREKLGTSIPANVTVEKVQPVLNPRPQRIYKVDLSNSTSLHLVNPPYSKWRPLRSDEGMVLSETIAVRWIKERAEQKFSSFSSSSSSSKDKKQLEAAAAAAAAEKQPEAKDEHQPEAEAKDEENQQDQKDFISQIPTIFHHDQEPSPPKEWYTFYLCQTGTPLSLITPSISQETRNVPNGINFQLGKLHRNLAEFTSPTGRFGPVAATIPPPPTLFGQQQQHLLTAAGGLFGTVGTASWSVAFHSMLEGSLRDGEDMAVVLSYSTIRRHFRRLGYLLDEVRVPRLVVVDGGDESNILVSEEEEGGKWRVKGLRDWSSCVFGDPLLGSVFFELETEIEVIRGFNFGEENNNIWPRGIKGGIIEDEETAWVRVLLYETYHAVRKIVGEFYRPRGGGGGSSGGSSEKELEARRRLNLVLGKLGEVPDDVKGGTRKKKHERRLSGEMSPAKRLRALPAPPSSEKGERSS
ncbi:hypothetical protein QBC38DRAFT_443052 [Podospora fimiseda]|uniref:Uncharacterized protein n=1 Tax=Podospora fimiseda TaxID=252190 RepID=A0AAN7BRJ0_9PEZI|nr:hypothetical protein QBC38DRAFT_443052 [Podospora fimiseda]